MDPLVLLLFLLAHMTTDVPGRGIQVAGS